MAANGAGSVARSVGATWGTIALLVVAVLVGQVMNLVLNAAIMPIKNDLGLSDSQIGAVINLPRLSFIVVAISVGLLADWRSGVRGMMVALGLLLGASALLVTATAQNLPALAIARFCGGAGWALTLAGSLSLAGSITTARGRAIALSLIGLGVALGVWFIATQSAAALEEISWRTFFTTLGVAAIAVSALVLVIARDPRMPRQRTARLPTGPAIAFLVAACVAHTAFLYGATSFIVSYAVRAFDLEMSHFVQIQAVASLAAAGGALVAGLVAAGGKASIARHLIVFAAISVLSGACLLAFARAGDAANAAAFQIAFSFASGAWFGVAYAGVSALAPAGRASFPIAVIIVAAAIAVFIGPTAFGFLSDTLTAPEAYEVNEESAALRVLGLQQALSLWSAAPLLVALLLGLALWATPKGADARDAAKTAASAHLDAPILDLSRDEPVEDSAALKGFGVSTGERWFAIVLGLFFVTLVAVLLFNAGLGGIALIVILAALVLGALGLGLLSRRSKQRQQQELRQQERFVLYLRPFTFDMKTDVSLQRSGHKGPITPGTPFEEALGAMCLEVGLGIKSVGPVAGQYGVDAIKSDDASWQSVVGDLMERAELIIFVPGPGPGCSWEIEQIASSRGLQKTVWVMPPGSLTHEGDMACNWSELDRNAFPDQPPPYDKAGALFAYARAGDGQLRFTREAFSFMPLAKAIAYTARRRL